MNRSRIFVVFLLLTAALSGIVIGRLFFTPGIPVPPRAIELQSGTALRPARPLPDFQLLRQDGVTAGRNEFLGRWTLVFFGFSHCPEVCPTTLAMLSGVRKALDAVVPAGELPGIALFSGSLYALALGAPRLVGVLTPFGGVALIAGWLCLAIALWRKALD